MDAFQLCEWEDQVNEKTENQLCLSLSYNWHLDFFAKKKLHLLNQTLDKFGLESEEENYKFMPCNKS